jgi:hypothetical protein
VATTTDIATIPTSFAKDFAFTCLVLPEAIIASPNVAFSPSLMLALDPRPTCASFQMRALAFVKMKR